MPRFIPILLCLIILALPATQGVDNISKLDKIRAYVNGDIITQGDIDIMLENIPLAERERQVKQTVATLVRRLLVIQKARELIKDIPGIEIGGERVTKDAEERIAQGYTGSREFLQQHLLFQQAQEILKTLLIREKTTVTPEEIKQHYNLFINDFREPAKVLIRDISIRYHSELQIEAAIDDIRKTLTDIHKDIEDKSRAEKIAKFQEKVVDLKGKKSELLTEGLDLVKECLQSEDALLKAEAAKLNDRYKFHKTEAAASKRCEEIIGQLAENADFGDLVIKFSEGAHRNNGGKWDWFPKGELSGKLKTIEDQAFKLKVNEVSPVLDASSTKYIIQKIAFKEESIQDLDDPKVQSQIYQYLRKKKLDEEWAKLYKDLHEAAYIKIVQ